MATMIQILEAQKKLAEEMKALAKRDQLIQSAQVLEEHKVKIDSDKQLDKLDTMIKQNKNLERIADAIEKTHKVQVETNKAIDKDLNKNVKSLSEAIHAQVKGALKAGYGEKMGEGTKAAREDQIKNQGSFMRSILLGGEKKDQIKKNSWFQKVEDNTGLKVGKFSPGMVISNMLEKSEAKVARKREKEQFVTGLMGSNDKRNIAMKNFQGEDKAREDAEKRFEVMKKEEETLLEIQKKIDASKAAGYNPMKKDVEARDASAARLAEVDPREKQKFRDKEYAERAEAREGKTPKLKASESEQEKSILEGNIGETLSKSLEVQQQSFDMLKKIAGGGGKPPEEGEGAGAGGGGMFSGMSGVAKNLLAFAGALFITAKALQEFSDVTWGGLFKGVLAMTAMVVAVNQIKDNDASKTLLALGASLWIVSKALQNFSEISWNDVLKGGAALFGLVQISKMVGDTKSAVNLLVLGGALWVVGKALQEFAEVSWEDIAKGGVALVGLATVAGVLGSMSSQIFKGSLAMVAMGGGLWVIGKALGSFAELDWESIGKGFVALIGLGAVAAVLGLALPFIIPGAIAIGALGLALIPFAAAMALAGPAMDQFASGMERLSQISAGDLLGVAGAIGALSVAMAAFGAGQAAAGLGSLVGRFLTLGTDSPVEQLIKIGQNGHGVMEAAEGLDKLGGAMKGFSQLKKGSMDAINDFPWIRATAFVAAGGRMKVEGNVVENSKVADGSKANEDAKAQNSAGGGSTNVVSAPTTTINNNNTTNAARSPIRNPEHTQSNYLRQGQLRYAANF